MAPRDFNRLSLNERTRVVSTKAEFLIAIDYYNYRVNLYALHNYFVEVKLTAITNDVESICIAKEKELEKFINRIELPML